MSRINIYIVLICLLFFFFSCGKDNNPIKQQEPVYQSDYAHLQINQIYGFWDTPINKYRYCFSILFFLDSIHHNDSVKYFTNGYYYSLDSIYSNEYHRYCHHLFFIDSTYGWNFESWVFGYHIYVHDSLFCGISPGKFMIGMSWWGGNRYFDTLKVVRFPQIPPNKK